MWYATNAPTGSGKTNFDQIQDAGNVVAGGHHQGQALAKGRDKEDQTSQMTVGTEVPMSSLTPPGLHKLKPLKKSMPNQSANELLTSTWDAFPPDVQTKLQNLGFGPPPPEEPRLEAILQTHLKELPQAVQDVVNKMQQPIPDTEKALAQKLKTQVTELKTISMKKAQLQTRLDQVKSQYATMLQEMQEHQAKLTDGQKKLKTLSEQYMQAVNKTPPPTDLEINDPELPIPMAVETFVTSLGIELTAEQLRRRQRETALAAWERAKTLFDAKQEEWQETLDQDYKLIYEHAINRLSKVFADSQHYVHQKAPRHQGKQTKQYKKELINRCRQAWDSEHHHWEQHQRSGFQCRDCGLRMHQGLTADILEARLTETCPQTVFTEVATNAEKAAPLPKKLTRAQQIKALLDSQPEQPTPGKHQLAETTGYLKCLVCSINIHKRVNEEAFNTFIQSPCVNQAYMAEHPKHPSHALWQIGDRVKCTQCGTHWNLDGQQRIIATQAFHKACKGAGGKNTPPISDFFKKKQDKSSGQSSETSHHEDATATRPTPRRLNFPTALDDVEQDALTYGMSELAMTPSHTADPAEDETLTGIEVDFF